MTKEELNMTRHNVVVKSNDFIRRSRFDLSVVEQKIILYMVSQIDQENPELKEVDLSLSDFCRVCGINQKDNLSSLKETVKKLADKSAWIRLENGDETLIRWIEKPTIKHDTSRIKIRLDRDLVPYLLDMKENFTSYELIAVLALKSKYSIRLYELLKSFAYQKMCDLSVVSLRKQLCADKRYEKMYDFRRYVLDTAVDEINSFTDLNVSYQTVKDGKNIIGFHFDVEAVNTAFDGANLYLEKMLPSRYQQEKRYRKYLQESRGNR